MQSFQDFRGFRHIDADDFKDLLLERALDDDLLSRWTEHELCDGRPVAPRELSSYVHAESTIIANTARTEALKRGEDVIVHGTLSQGAHADDLLAELDHHRYRRLTVVAVEVPCAVACQQALDRWWSLREQQSDPLGGRFIPPAVIRSHFEKDERVSICSRNARALSEKAEALGWEVDLRLVAPPSHPDETHRTGRRMTPHDAGPPRA
ncbi:zeta toxin family protein [Rothia sp. AR01]|uniref:UDP-N-acetylglucosamine kinase n=2 Tax=Rothia santali TaxID=2949643 RepID=A0A9X2HFK6_9MICC|nr:zeta toxin family protein [Rothia santali]